MNEVITVTKRNEAFLDISCSRSVALELSDYFKIRAENFRFHPLYKAKKWDGFIRLYRVHDSSLYVGLFEHLCRFVIRNRYTLRAPPELSESVPFSIDDARQFYESLKLPFTPYDHQILGLKRAIEHSRAVLLSGTASGKTLLIYALFGYYNRRTLLIVDNLGLIAQLASDFASYGLRDDEVSVVPDVKPHDAHGLLVISTWQSIYKLGPAFFEQFEVIIGDECHGFEAKSLVAIMERSSRAKFRFGTTGTLKGAKSNELTLTGLFGPVRRIAKTHELIKKNLVSALKIKCVVLSYPERTRKAVTRYAYQDELGFILAHRKRTHFVAQLALRLEKTTLILFERKEAHGRLIYQALLEANSGRKIFYVDGDIVKSEREEIRQIANREPGSIIVASFGCFAKGIDVRNLYNLIFASPSKAVVRITQSIGRALRKGDIDCDAVLYDIVDDLTHGKRQNFAYKHFLERVEIYRSERHPYIVLDIAI